MGLDADRVRLCRLLPPPRFSYFGIFSFKGREGSQRCIGKACHHYRADGRCSVDPDPADRWGRAHNVIEVTRQQLESGDY